MKRILFLLIVSLFMFSTVTAQVSKPFNVYLGGGLTTMSAPQSFKDEHKMGYNLSGGLGLKVAPLIQIVGKVEYQTFPKDYGDIFGTTVDILGGRRDVVMFGGDARLGTNIPMSLIQPFIFAGIGWAHLSQTDIISSLGITQTSPLKYDSQTKFYYNIGGGLEFKALMLTMFFQARYLNIKQDGENLVLIPLTLGFKF